MKFSIITVCLNAGENLIETVKSTLMQTYADFEIIVKDGFSDDGSIDRLPQDSRIKLVQKKDSGIYEAMNQGIKVASGDYYLFMNAGDLFFDKNVLQELSTCLKNQTADIFYGKSYNTSLKMFDVAPPKIDKYFCFRSMICHQATVYKGELMKKRGYNTEYKIAADRERLMYAVIEEKCSCKFIPVNIALFQGGGLSDTEKGRKTIQEEDKRLVQQYFTKVEMVKYNLKYMCTFPHIRKLFIKNIYIYRIYKHIVGKIYGTS